MVNFLFPLLLGMGRRAKARFIRKTRRTTAVQEQFLLKLLRRQQNTELGQKYGLREIKTVDEFRDRVPVLPYSSYQPFTERIFQGEANLLTADPVVYINLTSGSTGPQKLIPVTKRFQNSLKRANLSALGFLADALEAQNRQFGKLLITNTAQVLGQSPGGVNYGLASVGVLRMGKFLYQQLFAHPFETLLPSDSLTRHYVCLLFALRDRAMGGIIANFPMLLLRTCDYLERYAEDLIRDLEKGTIADWLDLEPEVRAKLERQWSADPVRARELREIIQSEGRLTPKLAWPNLSFLATARGGTSDFYFERFSHYFGDTPVFGAVYSSAEATFSIYPDVNVDGSVLAIESGFFEFVPPDQWDADHPETLLASEVKIGEHYRLLATNYSGFYRYDIGDVVEVVGFFEKAPLLVFRYRRGGIISAAAEKTSEHHATQVVQALQQEYNLLLEDFCLTLSESLVSPHYLINIELLPGQTLDDPQAFLASFDRKLQAANTSYALKRPSNYIPAPRLRLLAPGSFATLRQRQLAKGVPDSQLKFPHISEDRGFLAGLTVEREIRLPEDTD
jgi:hypothetical protein